MPLQKGPFQVAGVLGDDDSETCISFRQCSLLHIAIGNRDGCWR
jgi:hypothetical protein